MKRISDTQFKAVLIKELNKENGSGHSKTNFFELLRTKYSIHKGRALELHDKYYGEWANLREKGLSKGIEQGASEDAKKGIKSKTDRMLMLQNSIEYMEKQLSGELKFTFTIGNKIMNSHSADTFMLPIERQLEIRARIKEYTSELNKMDGSYAPDKHEHSVTGVKSIIVERASKVKG